MAKILNKYWVLILILVLSLLITWPLFTKGYFSHHDDLQVMRVFEMRLCLKDLQIPCRWVADMGFGNGFPLFNFYGVLPYYIGALASFILGYIGAAKLLFFIPLVLAGFSMYFLGKELGGKWVGLTAGVLYLFAPYRSVDTYVRGAIGESFAIAIVPLVFYFAYKLSKQFSKKNFVFLSLSLGAFLITHNIMTMLFTPIILLYIFYLLVVEKTKNNKNLIFALILGVGLSAFFLFPAFLEKNLIQTETLTRFDLDFRVHFVTVKQLFLDRSFGYGASVLGPNDTISFQIGWPHLFLALLSLVLVFKRSKILILGLFGIFAFSIFMTHNRSAFVWEQIGILRFTQFPWRFLSVSIFTASLLGGLSILLFKEKLQKILSVLIVVLTIILNFSYFKPNEFYQNMTDSEKLSGIEWDKQRRAGILDYLPKGAYEPREPAPKEPLIKEGKGVIKNFINNSNNFKFEVEISEKALVELPVFDFPNWEVFINGKKIAHNKDNLLKRIQFEQDKGKFLVEGRLKNTPIRTFSNLLTLASVAFLVYFVRKKSA